jgi:probable phosphoglycerate mutase
VGDRADEVLKAYRALLDEGDVVLVGHGHFSRVLTARWLGLPAASGVGFKLDAGGLTVLGDERGVPRLDHVNLVAPDRESTRTSESGDALRESAERRER